MKKLLLILFITLTQSALAAENPSSFNQFLHQLIPYAQQHHITQATIQDHLLKARYLPQVVKHDHHQPELRLSFTSYMKLFLTKDRINQGKAYYKQHAALLKSISKRYQVQPEYLVSILGVETNYGTTTGNFPVVSAIATLAYTDHRHTFFKRELMSALHMVQDRQLTENEMQGSWAGAMGQTQFMPDLYLNYAVSYNNKDQPDIWHNTADVLSSIANFFHQKGWNGSERAAVRVQLPANFSLDKLGIKEQRTIQAWKKLGITGYTNNPLPDWEGKTEIIFAGGNTKHPFLVNHNFHVLLRWNNSILYALAVEKLADKITDNLTLSTSVNTAQHIQDKRSDPHHPSQPTKKRLLSDQTNQVPRWQLLRNHLKKAWNKAFHFPPLHLLRANQLP